MKTENQRLVFVQLSNFSDTNSAIEDRLAKMLNDRRLDIVRVWPIIKKNPFWLAVVLLAGLWTHGIGRLRDRGALIEAIIKTPTFFRLAGWIARREIARGGPAAAVLLTQALFDPAPAGTPLVVYTDDCILNPVNRLFLTAEILPENVRLERRLYDRADRIAVGGRHVARALAEEYGLPPEKTPVIGMGANVDLVERGPIGDRLDRYAARHIVFVGIDWKRKGGPELLEAFRRLHMRYPESRLTILGCEPEIDHPAVEVLGRRPPATVAECLARASIFCMPSWAEPFGIATVEAARAGLPCVATATGGFLDTIRDGETGYLVPVGDVDALEAALGRLLADPELCRTMGLEGAAWARDRFSWKAVVRRLAEVLETTIAEAAAPSLLHDAAVPTAPATIRTT